MEGGGSGLKEEGAVGSGLKGGEGGPGVKVGSGVGSGGLN